jgi:hypothetical protein
MIRRDTVWLIAAILGFKPGDKVVVYGQWPGVVRGHHDNLRAVVSYEKHGNQFVGFVPYSKLKPKKEKRK